MFSFIVSMFTNLSVFVKCYTGVISTHSSNVCMHSIDMSFFVLDYFYKMNDSLKKELNQFKSTNKEKAPWLSRTSFQNVNVAFTNEKPHKTNYCVTSHHKIKSVMCDEISTYLYKVHFKCEYELFPENQKRYIVFFDDKFINVICYLSDQTIDFVSIYGTNKNYYTLLDGKYSIDFYFPELNVRITRICVSKSEADCFNSSDTIIIASTTDKSFYFYVFFQKNSWKRIEEILKQKSASFFNFDGSEFTLDEKKINEINMKINFKKNQQIYEKVHRMGSKRRIISNLK